MLFKQLARLFILIMMTGLFIPVIAQEKGDEPLPLYIIPQQTASSEGRATLTIEVNTTLDSVDVAPGDGNCADTSALCSLRAAIMESNVRAGHENIQLPAGTYTLTLPGVEDVGVSGDLDITTTEVISIGGDHAMNTIIDGGNTSRIFDIHQGAALSATDLMLTHGRDSIGGAVRNLGNTTLSRMIISENHATSYGGAISNRQSLGISASSILNNTSTGTSGAIDNYQLANDDPAYLSLANVTISGNTAINGAAILADNGSLTTIKYSTIVNNTASNGIGGIDVDTVNGGSITIGSTILDNTGTLGSNCRGTVSSNGGNLIKSITGCNFTSSETDQVGTDFTPLDPMLGPLANHGGYVLTYSLLLNSPARDKGGYDQAITSDARGVTRYHDGDYDGTRSPDIGAFEFAPPMTPIQPFSSLAITDPNLDVRWLGDSNAVKYQFQVRGVDVVYAYKVKRNASEICSGVICRFTPPITTLPNQAKLEWRVVGIDASGNKNSSVWAPFDTAIPGKPYLYNPLQFSVIVDTTPTLSWQKGSNITVYKLTIVNEKNGVVALKAAIKETTSVSLPTICSEFTCTVTTEQLGVILAPGNYKWQIMAIAQYSWDLPTGTVTKKYKNKSNWQTFTITNNPTRSEELWPSLPSN